MDDVHVYRKGRITGLDGRIARIAFDSFDGCTGCSGGCGFSQLARLTGAGHRGVLRVDVGPQSGLVAGDDVRVGIEAGRLLRLVFQAYFLPLIGLVSGAFLASLLAPASGDIGALAGAVFGGLVFGGPLMARSGGSGKRHSLEWLGARVTRLT